MNDFIQRLRERKLVQWALAYAAAAFALLQGFDIVGQQFDWSEGVRRGITIALGVGFVVTLVLAWYHGEKGAQRVTTRELLALALVLVLGGGVMWHFERAAPADVASPSSDSHDASAADKSIASFRSRTCPTTRTTPTSPTACRTRFSPACRRSERCA